MIGQLESLVKVGSDKGRFSEEEEDATAVALPVSVASPIVVSRESEEGIGGLSEDKMLESDILVQSGVTAYSWVGQREGNLPPLTCALQQTCASPGVHKNTNFLRDFF